MEFDWDDIKAVRNLAKHKVSFEEAASVFDDESAMFIFDEDHSEFEDRYRLLGFSNRVRLLVVTHTNRGPVVRIISARKATKHEGRNYEQNRP